MSPNVNKQILSATLLCFLECHQISDSNKSNPVHCPSPSPPFLSYRLIPPPQLPPPKWNTFQHPCEFIEQVSTMLTLWINEQTNQIWLKLHVAVPLLSAYLILIWQIANENDTSESCMAGICLRTQTFSGAYVAKVGRIVTRKYVVYRSQNRCYIYL